jgi:hypothetical protein
MHVKLQLVMYSDDGREETVTDVVTLQKNPIPPSLVVDRGVSYVGGCSALDFPFIHDAWPYDLPQNKLSNINLIDSP